jgi:hypothetical protein
MRVARQASASATGYLVLELKPEGEEERHHQFEKRFAVAQQLKVRRFVLKIDRDSPVFSGRSGWLLHGVPLGQNIVAVHDTHRGNPI